jgi:ABC-type uncharacterized transport system substrate-binding protein
MASFFPTEISCASARLKVFQQAAINSDRILKGKHPANLAVRSPPKFKMAVNMRTAKTAGNPFS